MPVWPDPLSDAFANDATKQTQWAAFIRRNGLTGLPGQFSEVVMAIREYHRRPLQAWRISDEAIPQFFRCGETNGSATTTLRLLLGRHLYRASHFQSLGNSLSV